MEIENEMQPKEDIIETDNKNDAEIIDEDNEVMSENINIL